MGNLKDAIRANHGKPRATIKVFLPQYQSEIILQRLTYGEQKDLSGLDAILNLHRFLARMIVDDNGQRIFADEEAAELDDLWPDSIILLNKAANELNGTTKAQAEDIIKNSETSLTTASVLT